jgi:hypothetical protein
MRVSMLLICACSSFFVKAVMWNLPSRPSPINFLHNFLCPSNRVRYCANCGRNPRTSIVLSIFMRFRGLQSPGSTVWPVIFGLTGPICARAPKSLHPLELRPRGHHDWPVKPTIQNTIAGLIRPVAQAFVVRHKIDSVIAGSEHDR